MDLMPVTIYTILQSEKLHAMYGKGGFSKFKEGKRWAGAAKLLAKAAASDCVLPIVFARAEKTYELFYHGTIRKISFIAEKGKTSTVISIADLKPFRAPRPKKTNLIVVSTMQPIPRSHIRPYVLCRTPSFIAVRKPRSATAKPKKSVVSP
jgi:hypothetical protein